MKNYSFHKEIANEKLFYEIWEAITRLKWYFYKFARNNAEEAMQMTLMHCLTHYNPDVADLDVYLKALAREITKDNGRIVYVDFMEQTLAGDSGDTEETEKTVNVNVGRVRDFSDDIVTEMMLDINKKSEIVALALQFMDKFITMCEALINNDTSVAYYPEVYASACLKLFKQCRNFNKSCISLYMDYAPQMKAFISSDDDNEGKWKETDYSFIQTNQSKRIKLINRMTGFIADDADSDDIILEGKLGDKRVIKVPYRELWDKLCDLVDSEETNQIKFVIDDQYIFRTLGGSLSIINSSLFNEYDLIRDEIVTNLLQDTRGRLLNIGSEHIYILISDECEIPDRVIRGINIHFDKIDITDSLVD